MLFRSGRFQEVGRAEVYAVMGDSPAANAGLREGDVITRVDDVQVVKSSDLRNYIRSRSAGDSVEIAWTSGGVDRSASIVLAPAAIGTAPGSSDATQPGFLGVGTESTGRRALSIPSAVGRIGGDLVSDVAATVRGIATVANPVNQWDQLTNEDADPTKRPTTVVGITMVAGDVGRDFGFFAEIGRAHV